MLTRSSKRRFEDFDGGAPDAASRPEPRRPLRRFRGLLAPYRRAIVGIFALAVVSAGLLLILPLGTRYAIDDILARDGEASDLLLLGGAMIAVIVVQQLIEIGRRWWVALINMRMMHRIRRRLFGHLLRLPLDDLHDLKTGDVVSRLGHDCEQMTSLLEMAIVTPGVALLRILSTLTVLAVLSWQLALAAVVILPLAALVNLHFIRRIRPLYRGVQRDRAAVESRVVETLGGIHTVRSFGRERAEARRYAGGHHAASRKLLRARALELLSISGWGFLIPVATTVIVCYGGYLHLAGHVSIGSILAFQLFVLLLLQPAAQIVAAFGRVQPALASADRVFEILALPLERDPALEGDAAITPAPLPPVVGAVEFRNVSFAYGDRPAVLRDVSFRVAAGSTVALVGPSGSGKTTATNLVARFYAPEKGVVLVNDVDVRRFPLRAYRRRLAIVHQDVFLFDGSVRENIAYGRRGASADAIAEAARRAHAHDFIESLTEGYETRIGERGVRLSGGQAQRIAIARALLANPQILILDEATSNLDAESEAHVQRAIAALIHDRTTLIIAHRLSTVVHADRIIVFEEGRIIATGTHETLLAENGRYREMVATQFTAEMS